MLGTHKFRIKDKQIKEVTRYLMSLLYMKLSQLMIKYLSEYLTSPLRKYT